MPLGGDLLLAGGGIHDDFFLRLGRDPRNVACHPYVGTAEGVDTVRTRTDFRPEGADTVHPHVD